MQFNFQKVTCKWTSADFHPAHYIAVDHCTEAVVLAIRGTFHIKDALTDLIAISVPFQVCVQRFGTQRNK